MNYFDLTGKVALITGGSSGLGIQFAKALASQGAKLALLARRIERLAEVKKELEGLGYEAFILKADVTEFSNIKNVVKEIYDHYGRIDILVNSAGVAVEARVSEMTEEEWIRVIDTNLNSLFFMAKAVYPYMMKNGYGRVINIGSIHSTVSRMGGAISSYVTAKAGVFGLTKALAEEWAKDGITVNAIGPAYFASEMTEKAIAMPEFKDFINAYSPMGRLGKAGELDGAIIYFASESSSFTTGQLLQIDGGWTTI